jgi:hypothetical protein
MAVDFVGTQPIEFQGHHTSQAYYKSGIMSPEYATLLFPE